MNWQRADVELGQLYDLDGLTYEVVALIDDPVVVIQPANERDGRRPRALRDLVAAVREVQACRAPPRQRRGGSSKGQERRVTVTTGAAIPHGTTGGYTNHYCRCAACKKAIADYHANRLRKPCVRGCGRLAWHAPGREGVCRTCRSAENRTAEHGTETRSKRCKCDLCREAANAARRRRRRAFSSRAADSPPRSGT